MLAARIVNVVTRMKEIHGAQSSAYGAGAGTMMGTAVSQADHHHTLHRQRLPAQNPAFSI